MLDLITLILGLLIGVAVLAVLAKKLQVPAAILMVLGGALFGLIPGLPRVRLNPNLVFLFFLPPLLYPAALFTSWRDFHANLRPISLLAVGLVLFTMSTIAWLAHHFMGLPLAAGYVLGAIISPSDTFAAKAITERLPVPRRIVTILDGESLVNDATALVAYRFAVAAIAAGSFSLAQAGIQFFIVGLGGILIGLVAGVVASWIQQRLDDPPVQITISLLTPFAAYLPADRLGASGVLAVVATGLYLGWRAPKIINARMRLQAGPVWEMIEFLLNGFIFILIGLQLPEVMRALAIYSVGQLLWYASLTSVAVISVRILWVFPAMRWPRLLFNRIHPHDADPAWQQVAIVGWTGMRGVVSLAAALALPIAIEAGPPFPGRPLIVFLTFTVILVTLVVQGLSLPAIIRWLGIEDDQSTEQEEREARLKANQAALARLNELSQAQPINVATVHRLRIEYEDRIRQLEVNELEESHVPRHLFSSDYEQLSYETLLVERSTILQLRNERTINDEVLRRIQRDIDLAEARLQRPE